MEEEKKKKIEEHYSKSSSLVDNFKKIYKSKIATVPTPGYTGYNSIFQKQVSYLNLDQILEKEPEKEKFDNIMDSRISESYRKGKDDEKCKQLELPYVGGYRGFRTGVKAGNYHGANFIETSYSARSKYLK